jgi:hypothetical protein
MDKTDEMKKKEDEEKGRKCQRERIALYFAGMEDLLESEVSVKRKINGVLIKEKRKLSDTFDMDLSKEEQLRMTKHIMAIVKQRLRETRT